MSILRYLTPVEGVTVAQLAQSTGQSVVAIRAELVALEAQGKAVRQRGAVGKPHLWWQAGRKPLSSLDTLLVMALAARFHSAPGKLRAVVRSASTRIVDPLGRAVVQRIATASNPHAVVMRAVEYHFED